MTEACRHESPHPSPAHSVRRLLETPGSSGDHKATGAIPQSPAFEPSDFGSPLGATVAYDPGFMKTNLNELLVKPVPPGAVWILGALVAALFGQWIQSSVYLNHDVSWIAHSAGWMLEGRRFGVDVLDPNPPLIWWLSMPAELLDGWGLLNEPLSIRLVFWSYFLASATLFFAILTAGRPADNAASIGWRIAFVCMATLVPGPSFGQREYLSVLFVMPYLAAAASRLDRGTAIRRELLVAAGLLAGLGFALKPYFLATPLFVEGLLMARLGWRTLFRTESLAAGLTIATYAVLVVTLVPQYLQFTIPLMRTIYWAFDAVDFSVVVARYYIVAKGFLYGGLIALIFRRWSSQHTVLLLAGAGYSASYFIQSKGFVYHAFPVRLFACEFHAVCFASAFAKIRGRRGTSSTPVLASLLAVLLLLTFPTIRSTYITTVNWYVQYNKTWGRDGVLRGAVIELVNRYAPTADSYFFAFSMHLFPGFPTASYTSADWSSRSATQGILAAYARKDELSNLPMRDAVARAASLQRSMVIDDLELYPPSIVFLERGPIRFGMNGRQFDDLAFYAADPRFKRIWTHYHEIEPVGPLRVFVRRDAMASGPRQITPP